METHADESRDWVGDFHEGCRDTFADLYRTHFSTVNQAVGRVLRGADQQTVVQDVFFKLLTNRKSRQSFRAGSFAAWIARLSRNSAVDFRRRRAREEPMGLELPGVGRELSTRALDVETCALDRITLQRCRGLSVPKKWQRVFDARFLECLTQEEAARRLGMSRSTLADQEGRICRHLRSLVTRAGKRQSARVLFVNAGPLTRSSLGGRNQ